VILDGVGTWRIVVSVVTALVLWSAWHSGGHVWRTLAQQRQAFAGLSEYQRRQAVMTSLPLSGPPFDFFRAHLVRGDRIYFNVAPGGYGEFDTLPQIIAAVGRYYLLPAVQVPDIKDATVVVSWNLDPALLGIHFVTQSADELQPYYVSRLKSP
jgi:hypothetical protein